MWHHAIPRGNNIIVLHHPDWQLDTWGESSKAGKFVGILKKNPQNRDLEDMKDNVGHYSLVYEYIDMNWLWRERKQVCVCKKTGFKAVEKFHNRGGRVVGEERKGRKERKRTTPAPQTAPAAADSKNPSKWVEVPSRWSGIFIKFSTFLTNSVTCEYFIS